MNQNFSAWHRKDETFDESELEAPVPQDREEFIDDQDLWAEVLKVTSRPRTFDEVMELA